MHVMLSKTELLAYALKSSLARAYLRNNLFFFSLAAMNTSLREEIEKLKVMTGQLGEGNEEIIAMDQIEQALFTCTSRLRGQASFQENVFGGIPTTTGYMKDAMPAS